MASQALVSHAYNPSYSGGRNQEDHGLKPAWTNSSLRPYLKNKSHKRASGVAQSVGPEFKPQHCKKKEKENMVYLHNGVLLGHKEEENYVI
jgi:hypothetical protein